MDIELAEVRDFLAAYAPFDALPQEELDALPGLCTITYARRGAVVLREGEINDRLYVVRSGAVDITDDGVLVDRLGAGDCFGMSAVVERVPTRHDVTAREDTLFITLPQEAFDDLAARHPAIAMHFAATHHGRIKTALGRLQQPQRGSAILKTSVRDLLRDKAIASGPDATIAEAAREMTAAGVSSLLIKEGGRLTGIITDRDLRRRVLAEGVDPSRPVSEVMTRDPVTVMGDALAFEVMLMMTGRNIHHLPVLDETGDVLGLVTATDLIRLERSNPVYLVADIARQENAFGVVEYAKRIPGIVDQLVAEDATAQDIGKVVTALTDAVTLRLILLTEKHLIEEGWGEAPGQHAWVALGSAAREEQALGGDQDHGLVLADDADPHDPWWAELALRVTQGLEECGFKRCDGDVMATNPKWRMRVSDWRAQFRSWSHEPHPDAVLWAAIFYDMRPLAGDADLVHQLREDVVAMAAASPLLLTHLVGQAARMRPPIGFFRRFVLEDAGEHRDSLDIKRGIAAIVQIARVYALRAGSLALTTPGRISAAEAAGQLSAETAADLLDAHELMCYLRLEHQVAQVRKGLPPDNHLDPDTLSGLDRSHLRDAFSIVRTSQQAFAQRFPSVG